ncbi:MAG: hypothetical protein GY865_12825 [candidate division Zixibacteria bacterium]|nr:hypothetical protein [candidate division Zixibacteria bacterium]
MKNTYKLFALILIICVIPTMVSAGLGARFGFSKDASNETYDEGMTLIGADYRFTAIPMVDIIGTLEYSWKKYSAGGAIPAEGTRHFFTANISVVKPFDISLLKPYAGIGYGFHLLGGSLSIMGNPVGGAALTGTGFHMIGGLRISPPAAPIAVYGEWRHYWTNFSLGNSRYITLSAGVMIGF